MEPDVQPFFVRHRRLGDDEIVVEIGGECDASTLDKLDEVLRAVVEAHPQRVVVDLGQATFVDSLTLGALTAAAQQLRADGASFGVVRADAPEMRRAFEITGLDAFLVTSS